MFCLNSISLLLKKKYKQKIACSILSQNCVGGVIYNMLGLKFSSPTINMFIRGQNFLKFCKNPEKYLNADAKPICDNYKEPNNSGVSYHLIRVLDIDLCAMHCKSGQEACQAYNRRKARFDCNNFVIIANTWDLMNNLEWIKEVLSYRNSIVFGTLDGLDDYENYIKLSPDYYYADEFNSVHPALTAFSEKKKGFKNFEVEFDVWNWLLRMSK